MGHLRFGVGAFPARQPGLPGALWLALLAAMLAGAARPAPGHDARGFREAPLLAPDDLDFARKDAAIATSGHPNALVVFAQFRDEGAPPDPVPDYAADLLDPASPGTFAHFYRVMSFGQLKLRGTVLPRRYVSSRPARAYLARSDHERGRYGEFVSEILTQVDADYDLGQFDNDGEDGIPNSGDDDGRVDYVFVIARSVPRRFILGGANGIAGLGTEYSSPTDRSARSGQPIWVGGQAYDGTILEEGGRAWTSSIMAHEFGHSLGLPDLYDKSFQSDPSQHPAEDGAGIGRWGLMGLGTQGWHGDDGPNPFCAWSLEQLGWIGPGNERLVEVAGDTTGLVVRGLHEGGQVIKVPIPGAQHPDAYLLLSHRNRRGPYDRHLPAEGLLIWHVTPVLADNDDEGAKLVDLVCADGLYTDAGYPQGRAGDGHLGGDNLDYWAHDARYTVDHGGNEGDETDPFDGERFTLFALDTNPSTGLPDVYSPASSGLTIRVRRQGEAMVVDIRRPRWAGQIDGLVRWHGDIVVEGDITVGRDGQLLVYQPARVRFAPTDRLRAGVDPERVEVRVEGALRVVPRRGPRGAILPDPARFEAEVPGTRWLGIIAGEGASTQLFARSYALADAEFDEVVSPTEAMERRAGPATAVAEEPPAERPAETALLPNYPNPFSGQTAVRYELAAAGHVYLRVFNSVGQQVRVLVDDDQPKGAHEVVWGADDDDGQRVAAGMYLSLMEIPGAYQGRDKMMLLAGGYALVRDLDESLRGLGTDWSVVQDELYEAPEALLGLVPHERPLEAALRAGGMWARLEAALLSGRDVPRAVALADALGKLVSGLETDDGDGARLAADLRRAPELPPEARPGLGLRPRLERVLQGQPDGAAVHFYLGEWLGGLELSARVARRLLRPLDEVRDPEADASVARQYAAALRELELGGDRVATLKELAEALGAGPRSRLELQRIVQTVERVMP